MRRNGARIGAGLAASAMMVVGLGVAASPASAAPSGLTFYTANFGAEVAHVDAPTGECTPLPAAAASHVGWSGFSDVVLYRAADCTGYATSTGTLRTYEAGRYLSYRAF
ncbi:hypothetical protein E1211_11875 [Micromonospora sp. 15K316]|uniref:hypothetical protein n=1 Tax=Micromonospora sp. 15K316 TaxID=2530376 RepID=UPI001052269F|nr:hypothetical protein [Micromonospora sp. 15K316]TDC36975.1 hypothetical protein E1211_11875 [Micromonospora sp. 15K316]